MGHSSNNNDGRDRARQGDAPVSQARGISIFERRERGRISLFQKSVAPPVPATSVEEKKAKERLREETETKERTLETKERISFFPKSPEKGAICQKSSDH